MIGYHVSKNKKGTMADSLAEAAEDLYARGFTQICAQIFVSGPQRFKQNLSMEDIAKCRKVICQHRLNLVIHGAYVDHPWNRAPGTIHNISEEMKTAAKLGATGVIVHLGAGAARDESLEYVLAELGKLPHNVLDRVILWLEIHAAKPTDNTYETPKKITKLFECISALNPKVQVGLCIDTAHLYSCGVALDSAIVARNWLRGLPAVPIMLHLNDSASELASGVDRHALLFHKIWKDYHPVTGTMPVEDSGLVELLNWAEENNIIVILERDEDSLGSDLTYIQQLGYFQQ